MGLADGLASILALRNNPALKFDRDGATRQES